jgi:hypothetical protein
MERFHSKYEGAGPTRCWNWKAGKNPKGYGEFRFQGKKKYAHRVAWFLEHGEWPDSECLRHRCHNPSCVNPAHLRPGTLAENNRDMFEAGRGNPTTKTGPEHGNAITEQQVINVNSLLDAGWSSRKIAEYVGIGATTVLRIKNGEHWPCHNHHKL